MINEVPPGLSLLITIYELKLRCFFLKYVLLSVFLLIPVTVAESERAFSNLSIIKSFIRSPMLQNMLTGSVLLSIEDDLETKIDYDETTKD